MDCALQTRLRGASRVSVAAVVEGCVEEEAEDGVLRREGVDTAEPLVGLAVEGVCGRRLVKVARGVDALPCGSLPIHLRNRPGSAAGHAEGETVDAGGENEIWIVGPEPRDGAGGIRIARFRADDPRARRARGELA